MFWIIQCLHVIFAPTKDSLRKAQDARVEEQLRIHSEVDHNTRNLKEHMDGPGIRLHNHFVGRKDVEDPDVCGRATIAKFKELLNGVFDDEPAP